ncbi:MAG: ABC transporter ATP-binding protein [Gammaproteobacteria bacterium]|nr:ABC transporter ATP-binding protein [Gammaproteobacteria bacterium]MBT5406744.1 ABC transporter ATP-binding protein [Gammaproteobacteria bacterium]MBT5644561.1 ABC transporter ATP-binding protein [Gammaproteobacteria bacterium]MBT5863479.1 ABC transporter ATP-binding protein [Gammaproteobacteria bacterium]MBT6733910.1 ABC transporter ATP-binding protein [Gammaproteobacteria bacterium]
MKLEIENISLNLDSDRILDNLCLSVNEEEILSIIGPSASGKTSLLRVIAGFENITTGKIKLNGQVVDDTSIVIEPQKRNVGIIFQDLALFPHLSCAENITFGISRLPTEEQIQRLRRLEEVLSITGISKKFPHEISGGQQQRVAIARALAPKPEILLLDEPFSALDEELKEKLLADVKILLKEEKITTIVITHNIKEAFQLSDKIAFLNDKKIIQIDSPYNIYHKPMTREIANFCGIGSFINGKIVDANYVLTDLGRHFGETSPYEIGTNVDIMIRPDDVIHDDNSTKSAQVVGKIFHGSDFLYKLKLSNGENIFCYTPSHHDHAVNEVIGIKSEMDHLILFSK